MVGSESEKLRVLSALEEATWCSPTPLVGDFGKLIIRMLLSHIDARQKSISAPVERGKTALLSVAPLMMTRTGCPKPHTVTPTGLNPFALGFVSSHHSDCKAITHEVKIT